MEVSSVSGQAKSSGSDFSIERILSEEPRSRQTSEPPSWLYCTRYRPPRIPRASSSGTCRRSGRHARVPFTGAQAAALEAAYSREPYLAPPALRALASALQLRDDRIKIWFQNRRARERREKSVTITPPHTSTLMPTNYQPINLTTHNIWTNDAGDPSATPYSCFTRNVDGPSVLYKSVSSENINRSHSDASDNCNGNLSDYDRARSESPLDVLTVDSN